MKKRVIVIGGGFGGLAVACRLAAHGFEVELFEKRDRLGGRAYVYEKNGFKFDGGPAVLTAPYLFDDIFKTAGKRREDYFELVPLNPFYRVFDEDGTSFNYTNDLNSMSSEIARWNLQDQHGYIRFLESTQAIYQKGFIELAHQPFLKISDLLKIAPDLVSLRSYQSVYGHVAHFIQNDFLRRVFSFHPLLVGGNPFDTTNIYSLIHFLEFEWGVYYAMGGTGAIVEALGKLFKELGGELYLNTPVSELQTQGRLVTGVRLKDGTVRRADIVISDADIMYTYTMLIPARYQNRLTRRRLEQLNYSNSLFVIYFGTRRRYTDTKMAHHNVILSSRYKSMMDDIFHHKTLSNDLSLFVHMPSKTDPGIAPPGCELFTVVSPVPNLDANIDWSITARPYRDRIMQFLEANFLPDLRSNILVEHYIDPLHFQNTLNSYKGAAYSARPGLTQSAWFRPHNRSEDYSNLYFVGAGTHPGAGLPAVLLSAKIADELIFESEHHRGKIYPIHRLGG